MTLFLPETSASILSLLHHHLHMLSIPKAIQVARWPQMIQTSHEHSQVKTTGRVASKRECFQAGAPSAYILLATPISKGDGETQSFGWADTTQDNSDSFRKLNCIGY